MRVSFTVWLEDDKYNYGDAAVVSSNIKRTVKDTLEQFVYLRDHRVLFNLTTSHHDQDSRFLSDLVIESFNQNRDAAIRNRLVVNVNCVQIRLIDLN